MRRSESGRGFENHKGPAQVNRTTDTVAAGVEALSEA